jgi:hypothetical protein
VNTSSGYVDDLWWAVENPEIDIFRDYLHSMEEFLQMERRTHVDNVKAIAKQVRTVSANSSQIPAPELEYDHYRLDAIDLFTNILRKTFFVSLYTFLEVSLIERCRRLERKDETLLPVSDIRGKGMAQAMTYLTKVHRTDFSPGMSSEWNEIQHYRRLRNCIVHNAGILDNNLQQRQQLKEYINRHPGLSLSTGLVEEVILSKDFCAQAIDTIARFLYALDKSMP